MEQLNIEGKRSGEGFVTHRERLVSALSRAQAPKVGVIDIIIGRKGFLSYLKALGGSNIVKVIPSNGSASEAQATEKGLKVICGSNTGNLKDEAWVTEKIKLGDTCQIWVSPNTSVKPNLGGIELAEALARVIPYAAGKKDERPVLKCVRFAQKEGKLCLTSADGFRLADLTLDFEDGEGEALIDADEVKGLVAALKKARRVRLSLENGGERLDSKSLVIDTELIRYRWTSPDGTYPDYGKVIPTEFMAEARFDTREMMKAAASLNALSVDKDAPITISVKDGEMSLSATQDRGQAHIEAEVQGEAEIALNGRYLIQALKSLGGIAEVKIGTPQTPILFSVDGYRIVIMPVLRSKPEIKVVAKAQEVAQQAKKPKRRQKAKAEAVAEAETEAEEPVAVEA